MTVKPLYGWMLACAAVWTVFVLATDKRTPRFVAIVWLVVLAIIAVDIIASYLQGS